MAEEDDSNEQRIRFIRDPAEDTQRWLAHRLGVAPFEPTVPGPLVRGRALELNQGAEDSLLASYGNQEIEGFVAFVDLKGYSTAVQGKTPRAIHDFVAPFLQGVADEAVRINCLVDKTIGDEVMLLQPNLTGGATWLLMGQALTGLGQLQMRLGPEYRFRIGLAYGSFFLGQVGSKDSESFREWTIFGEAIHLAKRLHGIAGLDDIVTERGVAVAFGLLDSDAGLSGLAGIKTTHPHDLLLSYLEGAYYDIRKADPQDLKGISRYRVGLLVPKRVPPALLESPEASD